MSFAEKGSRFFLFSVREEGERNTISGEAVAYIVARRVFLGLALLGQHLPRLIPRDSGQQQTYQVKFRWSAGTRQWLQFLI